jgi:hypothetical protein
MQGSTKCIRKVFICLMLQPCDHFIHALEILRKEFICIVWSENICPSLTRWILEFGFQVNISLECRPVEKLNRSNRIRLYSFLKMIFPVWTLQSVHDPFGMEYDQTVIIRFLWNDGAYARQIADILQAEFAEHFYQLRTIRF